jgi:hypothetical protein
LRPGTIATLQYITHIGQCVAVEHNDASMLPQEVELDDVVLHHMGGIWQRTCIENIGGWNH